MSIIDDAIRFVEEYHAADNSGHGADHIMRVYHTARQLADEASEPVDKLVLQLAALLHDVDDHKINPGGNAAEVFLYRALGKEQETLIRRILDTIAPISFSTSGAHPSFDTIEQKLLSDADKLDAMGAIGICRTVAYGSSRQRPLYGEPGIDTLSHFYEKLLLLQDAMQTESGKAESSRRHETMLSFLRELYRETGISENPYLEIKKQEQ